MHIPGRGEYSIIQLPSRHSAAHMLLIVSVRLVSKLRNCLPFFEKPLTSVSALANILSLTPSSAPPTPVGVAWEQLILTGTYPVLPVIS